MQVVNMLVILLFSLFSNWSHIGFSMDENITIFKDIIAMLSFFYFFLVL